MLRRSWCCWRTGVVVRRPTWPFAPRTPSSRSAAPDRCRCTPWPSAPIRTWRHWRESPASHRRAICYAWPGSARMTSRPLPGNCSTASAARRRDEAKSPGPDLYNCSARHGPTNLRPTFWKVFFWLLNYVCRAVFVALQLPHLQGRGAELAKGHKRVEF